MVLAKVNVRDRSGAVVIGRNEGARLATALASVKAEGVAIVYVDSGSTDDSVALARQRGDAVVELDPAKPFSAARARNEGLECLAAQIADLEFVLFLDGDCELLQGFVASAVGAMDENSKRAIVVGKLRERHPDASVYNRLCALEWESPAGDISNYGALGGIMLARIAAIKDVGGFNPNVIAGEDSELGVRIGLAGGIVTKIDVPMAIHDADINRFGQWWQRSVRAGHALGQRYALNGRSAARDCAREVRSTVAWGIALPLITIVLAAPTRGLSSLLLGGYLLLGWRIFGHYRRSGATVSAAMLGARFGVYSKFANGIGLLRYAWNAFKGRYTIIEYK
jgi:GT2 family glycosyltransferase